MKPDVVFKYQKILELLSSFPDLLKINQGFKRNEGYKKSLENDDVLWDIAKKNKILVFRGDDLNVLNRYYECAKKYKSDPIIRITADCPLIDSFLVDEIINAIIFFST